MLLLVVLLLLLPLLPCACGNSYDITFFFVCALLLFFCCIFSSVLWSEFCAVIEYTRAQKHIHTHTKRSMHCTESEIQRDIKAYYTQARKNSHCFSTTSSIHWHNGIHAMSIVSALYTFCTHQNTRQDRITSSLLNKRHHIFIVDGKKNTVQNNTNTQGAHVSIWNNFFFILGNSPPLVWRRAVRFPFFSSLCVW